MEPSHKRFLVKLTCLLVPVGIYLIPAVGLAVFVGEFAPLQEVAERQSGPTTLLYGRAYRDNFFAFKLLSTRRRRPEILVLGSSRSMQFRSDLFSRHKEAFYNAGGAVQNAFEVREFLSGLEDTAWPQLLIIGLDQPWFNTRTAEGFSKRRIQEQLDDEQVVVLSRAMNVGRTVFWDFLRGKIPPGRVLLRQDPLYGGAALGMGAVVGGNGFRNDGSYQYGNLLHPEPVEKRLAEGHERLRNDQGQFAWGNSVAQSSLREMRTLLALCRDKGIRVIGFSPPYAPGVYRKMADGRKHRYLAKSASSLKGIFESQGFAYFDFTDPARLEVGDEDMVDGFHGSEFVYLKIYLAMLESMPEILGQYSDLASLRKRALEPRAHRLLVFDDDAR